VKEGEGVAARIGVAARVGTAERVGISIIVKGAKGDAVTTPADAGVSGRLTNGKKSHPLNANTRASQSHIFG